MAINRFIATATTTAQVDTDTPASVGIGDVFTLTTTGFDGSSNVINYTAVDTSATTVSGALIALWNDSTSDLQTGVTASGTATVVLTADVAGTAFQVASSATGGSATFVRSATTANGSTGDWQNTANWSLGTVPGEDTGDNTEDVYVEDSAVDILYGLDNTGATYYLKSLHVSRTYTGRIGHNGATGLVGDYLQVVAAKLFVGELFSTTTAAGSGRIKIDTGSVQECDVIVYYTANPVDTNKTAFRYLAANAATDVKEIRQGSVGIAAGTGETATINDVLVSYETSVGTDAKVEIGAGVTMADLDCVGGETQLKCAATTVDCKGGVLVTSGSGTITTLNVEGGEAQPASNGTITTCNLQSGTADFTISAEARTVTTLNQNGGNLKYDKAFVTITNGPAPSETGRKQLRTTNV